MVAISPATLRTRVLWTPTLFYQTVARRTKLRLTRERAVADVDADRRAEDVSGLRGLPDLVVPRRVAALRRAKPTARSVGSPL